MEERKFVCKYCNKRFSCGKSLGGHIRTHMSSAHHHHHHSSARANNVASSGGMIKYDAVRKRKRDFLGSEDVADDVDGDGDGNSLIYGLRENPKKTMRLVHTNETLQLKFCKECGKGFPSLKALCGHMACHSEKEKPTTITNNSYRLDNYSNKNSFGISEKQKLVMDSQSDTEISAPRRSKRMMKFKTLTNSSSKSSAAVVAAANANVTFGNGSSPVSEVEHEQEEVARCLMMLSKDNHYHHKGRFGLFTESSDNNSVVLQAKSKSKSPSVDTKFVFAAAAAINNGNVKDSVSNGYGVVEKKLNKHKQRDIKKLKYVEVDYNSDNSDSGYFRYGPKKVDSDDSSEEVTPSREVSRDYDVESKKIILSREGGRSRNNTVFKKLILDDSAKRKQSYNDSIGISSKKTLKNPNGFANEKVFKYGCLKSERDNNNNKNSNYNDGSDYDSAYETDENSTDTESYPAPKAQSESKSLGAKKSGSGKKKKPKLKLKKSKEHGCPICNKIFRSGQALGGHKRSHFVGGYEENTLILRTSAPNHNPNPAVATSVVVPCLIDLNVPAPVDE